ncbi:hypothetical protein FHT40_002678 [Mycolicibacterium sp. BK556]|uniref:hypothetical protein n=1 Tax=unclassified Mycolicibacterium TaxID=2636767 RepID=UPI00162136F2|nr:MULTISPECIES: hypothetical protein [unclassified Mycolicibacterium]MBB3603017.1 hypothetical protein [Mycolicibacterium sp. BK556]MBB3633212.1 hypothetical protein [Mycolicibacterium sp. BK607]
MSFRLLTDSDNSLSPGIWIDRLDAFIAALDAIDADEALEYCEQAWDIWDGAVFSDPLPESHPAMIIVLGTRQALASVMAAAYRSTAEGQDPMPLSAVHASLSEELGAVRAECDRWEREGLPSAAEVRARSATAVTGLHVATKRSA